MDKEKILRLAKEVIEREKAGLEKVIDSLGDEFVKAVEIILSSKGRVIVTGIGKSGIVGKKIAATMTSLGTPAIFLHPSESLHGDLGIVSKDDVVLAISKSGNSNEFNTLIPMFKRWDLPVIAITANRDSELAKHADVLVEIPDVKEACPFDVAPTVSTTITMAIGDAMAIVLADQKNFKLDDFAALHPGGAIGKRIWIKVKDMMLTGKKYVPVVREDATMEEVILEMTSKRGITSIVDKDGRVVGVFTDGDLRRLLEKELANKKDIFKLRARDVMTRNPKVITQDELATKAARLMEKYGVTALIVIDEERKPIGIIHLHDLMRERVV